MYVMAIFYPVLYVGIFFSTVGGLATLQALIKILKGNIEESTEGKPGTRQSFLIFLIAFLAGIFFIFFGLYGEEWGFSPGKPTHR